MLCIAVDFCVEEDSGKFYAILREELAFNNIVLEEGFETDFASVPKFLWSVFPPTLGLRGALIHDYLYQYKTVDRRTADKILKDQWKLAGVDWLRRNAGYLLVRIFGWFVWYKCKDKLKAVWSRLFSA